MGIQESIKQDLQAIKEVLQKPKYLIGFFALFLVVGLLYSVMTGIFLVFSLEINPKLAPLNVLLLFLIAGLTSLVLTMTFFKLKQNWKTGAGEKSGLFGSIAGAFVTACPICQPIWLLWLGLGNASLFLIDLSAYIALAGIALLVFSLHKSAQSVYQKTCALPGKKA